MSFRDAFYSAREGFFQWTADFFQWTAKSYGFPENPGMHIYMRGDETYFWIKFFIEDKLPLRKLRFPPETTANNLLEIFFGNFPEVKEIERHFYQSKSDGYFSFYVENFRNSYFLPNIVSEYLQIQLNFCRDLSFLELCRDTVFGILVIYHHLLTLRLLLNWFISINPYAFPTAYYTALVDWFEELSAQYVPALNGIPLATPAFMLMIGKTADALNHLVFTMPFLPSEGLKAKTVIDGQVRDIIVFRFLPILWYKYPIPNEIREYWFKERTDILEYLLKAYKNVDIQFLPDLVVTEVQHLSQSIVNITSISVPAEIDVLNFIQL